MNYLEALEALKKGKDVEYFMENKWWSLTGLHILHVLLGEDAKFRLKPSKRAVIVNGKTFYPEVNKLEHGQMFYIPSLCFEAMYENVIWDGAKYDNRCLERGIVFLKEEDAIGYAKATLGIE